MKLKIFVLKVEYTLCTSEFGKQIGRDNGLYYDVMCIRLEK